MIGIAVLALGAAIIAQYDCAFWAQVAREQAQAAQVAPTEQRNLQTEEEQSCNSAV